MWEAGTGKDDDVENDEIFLVLAGDGTVTLAEESALELRPGVLVRLVAGDRTTSSVTDRIRKVYFTPARV